MPTAYVTVPRDDADRIARDLVENRIAACVNRVPCHSTYRWKGDVVDDVLDRFGAWIHEEVHES